MPTSMGANFYEIFFAQNWKIYLTQKSIFRKKNIRHALFREIDVYSEIPILILHRSPPVLEQIITW